MRRKSRNSTWPQEVSRSRKILTYSLQLKIRRVSQHIWPTKIPWLYKKIIFAPQICQQIEAIISKWRIAIKKFHLRRGLWTVHLSSTAGSALRDSRARIGWGSMRRTSTALPQKLSTYALSLVVTNAFRKRGTSKSIFALILEIAPSNVSSAAKLLLVWVIRETTSVDTTTKSKFIIIYISFRPYQCDICDKSYFRRYLLTTHMKSHHNEVFRA